MTLSVSAIVGMALFTTPMTIAANSTLRFRSARPGLSIQMTPIACQNRAWGPSATPRMFIFPPAQPQRQDQQTRPPISVSAVVLPRELTVMRTPTMAVDGLFLAAQLTVPGRDLIFKCFGDVEPIDIPGFFIGAPFQGPDLPARQFARSRPGQPVGRRSAVHRLKRQRARLKLAGRSG
jgi:hypothetical protein